MQNDILQELQATYQLLRDQNQQEEQRRRTQAQATIPSLSQALTAREDLLYSSIQRIVTGQGSAEELPQQMDQLNQRITTLLTSHSFPADWLDPVYHCKQCKDTGYTGEPIREMCACMKQHYYARLCSKIGLASDGQTDYAHWDSSRFSSTTIPEVGVSQRRAADFIRQQSLQWCNVWPNTPTKIILMTGKSGLGKTFTMHCMAKQLLQRNVNVMLISAYRLLDAARKAAFSGNVGEFDSIMGAEVLMIDDLGSEPLYDNVTVTQLFNLLNERITAGTATIISTNLNMKELRERYTERIASRLGDVRNAVEYRFFGEDLRRH